MKNRIIFSNFAILLFLIIQILSCHFLKENTSPIKKNYLYILWVEKAIEDNKKLPQVEISIRKNESKTLIEKAIVLKKKKQFIESIQLLENAIDKEIDAVVYYEYANTLSSARRFQDAIKAYQISLKLEYKRPELVLYNIACAYSLLNDEENTYKYLEKAIQKGYKAFEYMEKDPDLSNVRETDRWRWKKKIIAFTLPDIEIQDANVTGLILEGGSRISSYFFICKNGIVIRSDYDDWNCAEYGYTKGKWSITENQLEFKWEESCKLLGLNKITPLASNGGCSFTKFQFQPCQTISQLPNYNSNNISRFKDYDFKSMIAESRDGWLKRKRTKSEPPQCNPDFKPTGLKDLNVTKYFSNYE